MKYLLTLTTAILLAGCPEASSERTHASDECALNYAVTVIEQVGVLHPSLSDKQAEAEACNAAFDAVHLADEGAGDRWYSYHRAAWDNPSELMKKYCGDDLAVKADMLENDQILRFRCIADCSGHDPADCE